MSDIIERFATTWRDLTATTVDTLAQVYTHDAVFIDPFHRLDGLAAIQHYAAHMYENLISSEFSFASKHQIGDEIYLRWTMTICHKKLRGGQPIVVPGVTYLKLSADKVIYHEDYYDGAALIYENIPLLGSVIRLIKRNAQG
jgi:ketosteroid isomerase-like protein